MRFKAAYPLLLLAVTAGTGTAQVYRADPDLVRADLLVDFEDRVDFLEVHNGVLDYGRVAFAEGFIGQKLMERKGNDILKGAPIGPLTLRVGQTNQNLMTLRDQLSGNTSLFGLGPDGPYSADGVGAGAVSWMYARDASAVAFTLGRGGKGFAYVNFYRRDGTLIDSMKVRNAGGVYAFRAHRAEIAGVTIHNTTDAGLSIDDVIGEFGNE